MAQDVRKILQNRYPLPAEEDLAFLQKYWDELAAQGERVEPNTLGAAEIAVRFDPRCGTDD